MARTMEELVAALSEPFTGSDIQTYIRTWKDKKTGEEKSIRLTYAQVSAIIRRLKDVFGYEWSFRVREHFIPSEQVCLLGELTA